MENRIRKFLAVFGAMALALLTVVGSTATAEAAQPLTTVGSCGSHVQATKPVAEPNDEWDFRMTGVDLAVYFGKPTKSNNNPGGRVYFTIYDDHGSSGHGPYGARSVGGFNVPLTAYVRNSASSVGLQVTADITNAGNTSTYCSSTYRLIITYQNFVHSRPSIRLVPVR